MFDESLQRELLQRLEIEQALAATLARGGDELELHYQPVIDTVSGTLKGAEALIRWRRPDVGMVYPDDFIPIAETTNLVIELDQWVLATAARQAVVWGRTPGLELLTVAVNVSGRHLLSEHLYDNVRAALDATGLDPKRLVIEVTETVLLTDIPLAAGQLDAIRALGVRVAIDDFGTGYSSLGALQGLPIDSIKVDRSFVSQIDDTREHSLVAMITQLGHHLGVTIVAEGVETSVQRTVLTELGCDEMQGYLICRPVPAADLQGRYALVRHTAEG
jgi:EAL domain-containing protein (putative c-di-GMP-specific phosphodiesterase class I)